MGRPSVNGDLASKNVAPAGEKLTLFNFTFKNVILAAVKLYAPKAGLLLLWSFVYKTYNFLIQTASSELEISQMLCFLYFGDRQAP